MNVDKIIAHAAQSAMQNAEKVATPVINDKTIEGGKEKLEKMLECAGSNAKATVHTPIPTAVPEYFLKTPEPLPTVPAPPGYLKMLEERQKESAKLAEDIEKAVNSEFEKPQQQLDLDGFRIYYYPQFKKALEEAGSIEALSKKSITIDPATSIVTVKDMPQKAQDDFYLPPFVL